MTRVSSCKFEFLLLGLTCPLLLETGFGRIRIKGVEEMEARTKLNRFAATQPKEVQESIGELLDQGATAIEVLNLLKEIAGKKGQEEVKE